MAAPRLALAAGGDATVTVELASSGGVRLAALAMMALPGAATATAGAIAGVMLGAYAGTSGNCSRSAEAGGVVDALAAGVGGLLRWGDSGSAGSAAGGFGAASGKRTRGREGPGEDSLSGIAAALWAVG